jgi:hypothetical protein
MNLAVAAVTNRTVERKGVVIELDQLSTAQRAEFLFFAGEEVEFVVHGNIPGGVVHGVEGERGINIVAHGTPPMELLSCHDPSFTRIFVRQIVPEFCFGKKLTTHGTKDTKEKRSRSG